MTFLIPPIWLITHGIQALDDYLFCRKLLYRIKKNSRFRASDIVCKHIDLDPTLSTYISSPADSPGNEVSRA